MTHNTALKFIILKCFQKNLLIKLIYMWASGIDKKIKEIFKQCG